jgi:hypothetical protein
VPCLARRARCCGATSRAVMKNRAQSDLQHCLSEACPPHPTRLLGTQLLCNAPLAAAKRSVHWDVSPLNCAATAPAERRRARMCIPNHHPPAADAAQQLQRTLLLRPRHRRLCLLVGAVEDGDGEALLGDVQGQVLRRGGGKGVAHCAEATNQITMHQPHRLVELTCPITARPTRPI